MKKGSVLLVNTNVTRPPVSPVGLEYLGENLVDAKIPLRILDLAFEKDWREALARELEMSEPLIIGLSVRNTDDCCSATRKSFLPWIKEVVEETRSWTKAFILLGGVGFSVMPEAVLGFVPADGGITGDGETVVPALAERLLKGEAIYNLPNLIYRQGERIVTNLRQDCDLSQLPAYRRGLFDNQRYEAQGAIVGIETKRGCSQRCVYCADPVAKGKKVRLRPPEKVAQEFERLLAQGVSWFHLGDSEFNLPIDHAKAVCQKVIQAGLGDKIRWYCYCAPIPFDRELVRLMKKSGCQGVNFGVDSLADEQLLRLGRVHTRRDAGELVQLLREEGLNYMFDLLVGGPGENEATLKETIERVKALDVPQAGIAAGVRVYPGTLLGKAVASGAVKEGLFPGKERPAHEPLFYLSPYLGSDAYGLISELVAEDKRFLFLSAPEEKSSYNYAGDSGLSRMIQDGERGAYWDIIRRTRNKF
ncbi:MAG: radical SAM protein [Chloroflexota bacterium]